MGTRPGQQHNADRRILAGVEEGFMQFKYGLRPEGVALLRAVKRDFGDPIDLMVEDVLEGFYNLPGRGGGRSTHG
jgi:hypothetical protein